ncbi:MAG: phospho-N-acetylmuramoyl-pentapeptide-transferase [Chloroflexi bacterium]|nr:phospho-N-acetylmuramoyl-pentapeptide-transferase [Chloroflexota bacterium]
MLDSAASAANVLLLTPLAFAAAVAWAPWLIGQLTRLKLGKAIRVDGPQSHMVKAGTPTMGGWLMVATTSVLTLIFVRDIVVWLPLLFAMIAFALYGTLDDYTNMHSKEGLGLKVRYKFIWHTGIALIVGLMLYSLSGVHAVAIPGWGTLDIGWGIVPLAALAIFSTTSGVNEIDGLDGLAAGTTALSFGAYLAIALLRGQNEIAAACAIIIGTMLAFLWFNVHPARVFMGDTGSLALGAALATVALLTGWVLLLPIIGIAIVAELLSVIIQVAYFKATKGKRIFKMSPLHHHFELSGWPEVQVVQRFWLVAALAAVAGVIISLY